MSAPNPFQNIPAELRVLKQWVNWKIEERGGKSTKVPYQPNGKPASTTDPKTWSTFERVCASNGNLAGRIGFVFTEDLVGIDFDHCRDKKTGVTDEWAHDVITELDSFTELSQSGEGWHVIVKGKLPGPGNRKGSVEMYEQKRFFCMTGIIQNGLGRMTIERRDVSALHKRMLAKEFVFEKKSASKTAASESDEDFRLIGEVYKESHAATADALEEAFRQKHPERYAERNRVKKNRGGKNYTRYSIENFLMRERGASEEPFVPRMPVTETANAERLVEKYGEEIRYCSDRRVWCAWDGSVWNVNDAGGVSRRTQQISLDIYGEASGTKNEKLRKALAAWAVQSESRRNQENSAALARYIEGIEVREFSSVFDTHPMLLNVKNGTIDLRTGELHPHRRDDFLTKMVPIEYDAKAECVKFKDFLSEVLPGEGLSIYLTKIAGYCLSGMTSEQVWWLFHGVTASGKSTLIKILHGLLGPYARALPENFFLVTNSGKDYSMASLAGVRLATCVETNEGRRLDVAKLKYLTGEDVISAEKKYQDEFNFTSQAKLILATNNKPHVSASDDAIWRRLKLVPFNISVAEDKRIPDLAEKLLEEEAPGILRWAVLGCQAWLSERLGEPLAVKDAGQEYRTDEDIVKNFVNDCCVTEDEIERKELYSAYAKWCKENHVWQMHAVPFGRDLKRLGVVIETPGRTDVRKWLGIRLRQLGDPEPGNTLKKAVN